MLPLFILLSSKVRTTAMCAEQIREKVKGKKKRIQAILVVMWHYSSLEEKVKITLTR